MVLGISSFAFGWSIGVGGYPAPSVPMTETTLVDYAVMFGVSSIQIGDNLPVHTLSPERQALLRSACNWHGIQLEIGARKLTETHLQRYLDICRYFQAPLLRFVMDGDDYEPDTHTIIDIVKGFVSQFEKQNITLGIENHDRFKARELANIVEAIGSSYVGVCLDCVNSMGAGEGLEQVVKILAPYTVNLHIKDFVVERLHHKMGFTINGTPAGMGMTDVPLILDELARYNRCQSAVLEQWVPFDGDIEATSETEKEWASEGMDYLKSLACFNLTKDHSRNDNRIS